jgi:hypothetical protein
MPFSASLLLLDSCHRMKIGVKRFPLKEKNFWFDIESFVVFFLKKGAVEVAALK